jgi:hypothetical protein
MISEMFSILALILFTYFILLACTAGFLQIQEHRRDLSETKKNNLPHRDDRDLETMLYQIGMESPTAYANMHAICKLLNVPYPPKLFSN